MNIRLYEDERVSSGTRFNFNEKVGRRKRIKVPGQVEENASRVRSCVFPYYLLLLYIILVEL